VKIQQIQVHSPCEHLHHVLKPKITVRRILIEMNEVGL